MRKHGAEVLNSGQEFSERMAGEREFDEKKNLLCNIRSHSIKVVGCRQPIVLPIEAVAYELKFKRR